MIAGWEKRYGAPALWWHTQPLTVDDHQVITRSQRHGRRHDITLYIEGDGAIAVIAKPFYPPGLFRAPSGGLDRGEELEVGAAREALEETGLHIVLSRYLLRAAVTFESPSGQIEWLTHVFTASTDDRVIRPIDTREIGAARWAAPDEFEKFGAIMRGSGRGGLQYRARLHEQVSHLHPLFLARALK